METCEETSDPVASGIEALRYTPGVVSRPVCRYEGMPPTGVGYVLVCPFDDGNGDVSCTGAISLFPETEERGN